MFRKLFMFLLAGMCLTSCSQSHLDVDDATEVTEADLFLASDEFKQFEKMLKEDSKIVRNALKVLTNDEKARYFELIGSVYPEMPDEEYNVLVAEIKQLTGIDTDKRLRRIYEAKMELKSKITFTKKELLDAIQRHCLTIKSVTLSRSTNEVGSDECYYSCEIQYWNAYYGCDGDEIYNPTDPHPTTEWEIARYCEFQAQKAYDECAKWCD